MADQRQYVTVNFVADQGSPWRRFLRFWQDAEKTTPLDLTGYALDMQIREGVADSGAETVAHLSSRIGSDETQRIFFVGVNSAGEPVPETEDATTGCVMLALSAADTRAIVPGKVPRKGLAEATFVYDIDLTPPGGEPEKRLQGEWVLNLEVTRR